MRHDAASAYFFAFFAGAFFAAAFFAGAFFAAAFFAGAFFAQHAVFAQHAFFGAAFFATAFLAGFAATFLVAICLDPFLSQGCRHAHSDATSATLS